MKVAKVMLVLGSLMLIASTIMLFIISTTTIFYSKNTSPHAGSSSSLDTGKLIALNALITWDETSLVLDINDNITKWATTLEYADEANANTYTYDLYPSHGGASIPTRSNGDTLGFPTTNQQWLQNTLSDTQKWSTFPRLSSPHTIVLVGTNPITAGSGLMYSVKSGENTSLDCSFSYKENVGITVKTDNTTEFTSAEVNFKTGNVVGYTYSGELNYFLNGENVPLKPLFKETFSTSDTSLFPTMNIGRVVGGTSRDSSVFAILVYNYVLSPSEMSDLNDYLTSKYLAPKLKYPDSINIQASNDMLPLSNQFQSPGAKYSITPNLPTGMTFDPDTGMISGTPTKDAPTSYVITGSNEYGRNMSALNMNVGTDPITVRPPYIGFKRNVVQASLGTNLTTTPPISSGGDISNYTIDDVTFKEDTDLTFNPVTGVASGLVDKETDLKVKITGENAAGKSSDSLELRLGITINYPKPTLYGFTNRPVDPFLMRYVEVPGCQVVFTTEDDLAGLTLDPASGEISGVPTSVGQYTVNVVATYESGKRSQLVRSAKVKLVIAEDKVFTHKTAYLAGSFIGLLLSLFLVIGGIYVIRRHYAKNKEHKHSNSK